ncbi:hypothetical protein ACE3MQ_21510 [Paenibacillus lentus]
MLRTISGAHLYDFSYKTAATERLENAVVRYFVQTTAADKVGCRLFLPPYNHPLNNMENDGSGHKADMRNKVRRSHTANEYL